MEELVLHIVGTELVDASDGSQLWGEQYNRKLADIFALQGEIANEISGKLRLRLTGDERKRLTKRDTGSTEAYQLYLKGRYHWNRRTEEGLKKGIDYFNQAIEKDPNYALAYVGLADCYHILAWYSYVTPKEAWLRARAAATRALEIDESLAEAHNSLAGVWLFYEWDWPAAERSFKRAIELNSNYATARHWHAHYLTAMGRLEQAIAEMELALELDPLSLIINAELGWMLYFARKNDQAIERYRRTLELAADFGTAHSLLGFAYLQKGMYGEAISEYEKAVAISAGNASDVAALGSGYAAADRREEALQVLQKLEAIAESGYVAPYSMALLNTSLGRTDQALAWLEKAFAERSGYMVLLNVEPSLDRLRPHPQFQDLVGRVGLPPVP